MASASLVTEGSINASKDNFTPLKSRAAKSTHLRDSDIYRPQTRSTVAQNTCDAIASIARSRKEASMAKSSESPSERATKLRRLSQAAQALASDCSSLQTLAPVAQNTYHSSSASTAPSSPSSTVHMHEKPSPCPRTALEANRNHESSTNASTHHPFLQDDLNIHSTPVTTRSVPTITAPAKAPKRASSADVSITDPLRLLHKLPKLAAKFPHLVASHGTSQETKGETGRIQLTPQ